MANIYSTAFRVYIWLGTQTRAEMLGIQYIDSMQKISPRKVWSDQACAARILREIPHITFDGICKLMDRDVWSRLWTVQEATMGHRRRVAVTVLGTCHRKYEAFVHATTIINAAWHRAPSDLMERIQLRDCTDRDIVKLLTRQMRGSFIVNEPSAMYYLGESLNVTKPVDRVYGSLGLFPELNIVPDYTAPVLKVYEDATFAILRYERSLRLILTAALDMRTCKTPGLSSWAADWGGKSNIPPTDRADVAKSSACAGTPFRGSKCDSKLAVEACKVFAFERDDLLGPQNPLANVSAARN